MKYLFLTLSLFVLSACATPEYQRVGENGTHRVGYSDVKVTDNSFRVKYLGTDSSNAYIGFMRRSSDLALSNGFNYFTIRDVGSLKESGPLVNLGAGVTKDWSLPQYEATIVLHKGSVPDAVNAKEFLKNNPIPVPIQRNQASTKK